MVGIDRLERGVLGLEANTAVRIATERLDRRLVRRLVVADERDHDLAVAGVVLAAYDDEVSVEDPGIDHGLACHAEEEVGAPAPIISGTEIRSSTSSSAAAARRRRCGRQVEALARHFEPSATRQLARPAQQLERARLGRVAAKEPGPLEICEVSVNRRRRGEPDGVADLTHRGRVPVIVHVADEELPDLLLACGQLSGLEHLGLQSRGDERMFVRGA